MNSMILKKDYIVKIIKEYDYNINIVDHFLYEFIYKDTIYVKECRDSTKSISYISDGLNITINYYNCEKYFYVFKRINYEKWIKININDYYYHMNKIEVNDLSTRDSLLNTLLLLKNDIKSILNYNEEKILNIYKNFCEYCVMKYDDCFINCNENIDEIVYNNYKLYKLKKANENKKIYQDDEFYNIVINKISNEMKTYSNFIIKNDENKTIIFYYEGYNLNITNYFGNIIIVILFKYNNLVYSFDFSKYIRIKKEIGYNSNLEKIIYELNSFIKNLSITNIFSMDKFINNIYNCEKTEYEEIEDKFTIPTSYIMTSNEFINSYNKIDLKDIKRNFIENIKYYYHDIIKEYVNKISFESDGINHSFKMIFNKCLIEIVYTKIFNIYIYYKENKKIVVKPLSDYLYNFYSKEERIINWVNGINNKKPFNVDENIKKLVVPFYYEDDESIIKLMEDIKE